MRFPSSGVILFVAVWAIVAAVPSLRNQTLEGKGEPKIVVPIVQLPNLRDALKASPGNSFLLSQQLQEAYDRGGQAGSSAKSAEFFHRYDALIAKDPNSLELRRTRLRLSTQRVLLNEPHMYEFGALDAKRRHFKPTSPPKIQMSPAQLETTFQLARDSGRLAPNDAFFPFMEAITLSGLGRDRDALVALDRAGRCRDFNDGAFDEARAKLALLESHGPVEWDDKLLVMWAQLFPHFGSMRSLVREMSYSGAAEYKAGHKAEAWRRWESALRAGAAMRRGESHGPQSSYIGLLVSEAFESLVWLPVAKEVCGYDPPLPGPFPNEQARLQASRKRQVFRAELFEKLARRDGHIALADFSHAEFASTKARGLKSAQTRDDSRIFDDGLGWHTPQARAIAQLPQFGWQALIFACICGLGWPLSALANRGGRETSPPKSLVWSLTIFFTVLWLGITAWAFSRGSAQGTYNVLLSLVGGELPAEILGIPMNWEVNFWLFFQATTLAIIVIYAIVRRFEKRDKSPRKRRFKIEINILTFVWLSTCLLAAWLWIDGLITPFEDSIASILLPAWIVIQGLSLFLTWRKGQSANSEEMGSMIYAWSAALGLGSSILITHQNQAEETLLVGFILAAASVGLLMVKAARSWRGWSPVISFCRSTLDVYGRVMANLALVISVAYLGLSISLWPARQQLNARVDKYIQQGEIEWMRDHKLHGVETIH